MKKTVLLPVFLAGMILFSHARKRVIGYPSVTTDKRRPERRQP
ncbi:MAG: hypothetical protein ABW019_15700 [Chitinophagaceae bacterium]